MPTQKITKNTTLEKILKIKGAEEVLAKFNFPCLSCPMAAQEINFLKIGDVCKTYGIELEKVINELKKLY